MRPPLSRRGLIALAGTTLSLGGCLGSPDDGGTTDGRTTTGGTTDGRTTTGGTTSNGPARRSPGGRYETADGWSMTVESVGVRYGVVRVGTVHVDPVWRSGSQFVVADLAVDGDGAPDPADLAPFVRTDTLDRSKRRYDVRAETTADGRRQRFGFPVPTDPAPSRAAVVWPDGGPTVRWSLGDDLVRTLGLAPAFAVESFSVPETVAPDDEFEATLAVRNDGARDGTFLAEVGSALISDQPEVALDVPAGETVTSHPTVEAYFGDRDGLPVVLRWEGRTERRTVRRT